MNALQKSPDGENLKDSASQLLLVAVKVLSSFKCFFGAFLQDGHLGSFFLRDSKGSLIVASLFLKDRHLGSFFLRD
tara:strand:- start:16 stop:243 length:228 start_codon:yes stop_codon:yes gene_type:complete